MLQFFGRRSAFFEPQNSAFFVKEKSLVLLDCAMSTFHRLKAAGPEQLVGGPVDRIYILVTHTHGDHIGGIPMLIHYCFYVLHIPGVVLAPSAEVRKDLEFFIEHLEGCHGYTLLDAGELADITVSTDQTATNGPVNSVHSCTLVTFLRTILRDVIPTTHSPELEGRCFGYRLRIDGHDVVYTGDTGTLEPFLPYLTEPGTIFYTEASVVKSPVHLFLPEVLEQLRSLSERGIPVYLMHLDDEDRIQMLTEGTRLMLAPLYDESIKIREDNPLPQQPEPLHDTERTPAQPQEPLHGTEPTPAQPQETFYDIKKEDPAMSQESAKMLSDIFAVSDHLYAYMNSTDLGDHSKIFEHLTSLGKILAEADRASFWKWDKASHTLWTTAATGTDRITIPDTTGLVGKALSLGKVVVTNDPYNDPDFNSAVDKKTGYVTKSILVMPVANIKGEFIGAYQVINKLGGDGKFHEEEDCKKLSLAAVICGLALESDVFLEESHTDKLTKLRNRMGFFSDFKRTYDKVIADPNRKLSLFICDIDKFKSVNDTYGHNAGDEVLKNVANIMQKNTEATDGIYRWGGEEFIMIMVDADMEKAAAKAESIRKEIEGATCECFGYTIRHTMSFGVTEFDGSKSIEANISVADEKLYTAKESGRNRVII